MFEKFDDIVISLHDYGAGTSLPFQMIRQDRNTAIYDGAFGHRYLWQFICGRYHITALIAADLMKAGVPAVMDSVINAVVADDNCTDPMSVRAQWSLWLRKNNIIPEKKQDPSTMLAQAINNFSANISSALSARAREDTANAEVEAARKKVEEAEVARKKAEEAAAAEKTKAEAETSELRKLIAEMQTEINELKKQQKK